MTDGMIELDSRLQQLADELNHALIGHVAAGGHLATPGWRAAFEAVPRHLFAPRFTLPDNLGRRTLDSTYSAQREEWLRAAYVSDALLTEFDEHDVPTTSCRHRR